MGSCRWAPPLKRTRRSRRIRTALIETLREGPERERVVDLFGQHVSPAS
ncbi:MAG: hypothetical protein QOE70_552 [Chthoniobacter sp.]|jgi:hypothetical protein|nr:hypothetical protein [Chthoniobacter sp.]